MKNIQSIGLVLSGGGVRGAAHAGILKAMLENGIEPNMISGSSAGAMAGALYAAGFQPDEIFKFFKENSNVFRWQNFARTKPGFLDTEKYAVIFKPWLNGHTFESIAKKLTICVTDVLNAKVKFISEGELIYPILASAAVPGIFSPVEINDNWYIDGGTMNNFPIEPLVGRCDFLIGSFVSNKLSIQKKNLTSTYKLVTRANELAIFASSQVKFGQCDFLFNPPKLANYHTFETKRITEIFQIGYDYALQMMPSLLEVLNKKETIISSTQ